MKDPDGVGMEKWKVLRTSRSHKLLARLNEGEDELRKTVCGVIYLKTTECP